MNSAEYITETMILVNSQANNGAPVDIIELREAAGLGSEFEAALREAHRDGAISLQSHDRPASLSTTDRAGYVANGRGSWYVVANLR